MGFQSWSRLECTSATPPREWLLDLGKGGAHDTNAHNMFDGMPSQPEVFNDDERISETVPIKSTMKKEGISMNKALDRLLEKFELMEANLRQEEKFNQILHKLQEIEACRSKAAVGI